MNISKNICEQTILYLKIVIRLSLNDDIHNSEDHKLPQYFYSKQNGSRKWIYSNE